ncbi:MAG: ABC transporter permease [Anaerolineae bacterium]|nr:ABC transporter permease [Anaerolineae bacterium]
MTIKENKKNASYFDSTNRGPLFLEELIGIYKYRELVIQFVRRDVITRYKRSALGFAWTMLNPLGTMLILTFVFSNLFHAVQGYPIYILSGIIAWTFFSQTTTASLTQNVLGAPLLHKIYLPRTTFTVSAIGTGIVNLVLSIVPLLLIIFLMGFPFHITFFFIPLSIIILAAFALGVGLLFSTIALFFPDVVEMYQIALTAWMYMTPIFYPIDIIPEPQRQWLIMFNPMYYLVEVFRQPIYDGILPSWQIFNTAAIIAFTTLVTGWVVFSWKANEFTYRT